MSEKKGTFICELKMERYVYLRNTQKQLKITSYGRNKSFLEIYNVNLQFRIYNLQSTIYIVEIYNVQ